MEERVRHVSSPANRPEGEAGIFFLSACASSLPSSPDADVDIRFPECTGEWEEEIKSIFSGAFVLERLTCVNDCQQQE